MKTQTKPMCKLLEKCKGDLMIVFLETGMSVKMWKSCVYQFVK